MKLTMRIKPHEVRDGLLAYSAQMDDGGDFASLSIKNGRVEFRYDSGSGNESEFVFFFFLFLKMMN